MNIVKQSMVFCSMALSFIVSVSHNSLKFVLRSTQRYHFRYCCRKQHSYTLGIDKPQRNACGFHEHCYSCTGCSAVWRLVILFPNAQIILGSLLCDQRPDLVVNVVGSSTLILQELTNRNEMLVVSHEHCYAGVCFRTHRLFMEVRSDVVVDVVGSSTLILQEQTNRNEMLVVAHEQCSDAQGFLQCGHQFYCFRMHMLFFEVRPDVADVVVGRSTLILQELTNRNEMLMVPHEHCYACAGFSAVWSSVLLFPNAHVILRSSSRYRRRCCFRKQHSYTSAIDKPQRNACVFS